MKTDLQLFDEIIADGWKPCYERALKRIRAAYVERRKTVRAKRPVQQAKPEKRPVNVGYYNY